MFGMLNQPIEQGGNPPPLPPRRIVPPAPPIQRPQMPPQLLQQIRQHQFMPQQMAGVPNFQQLQAMQQQIHQMAMQNPHLLQMMLNLPQGGLLNQLGEIRK